MEYLEKLIKFICKYHHSNNNKCTINTYNNQYQIYLPTTNKTFYLHYHLDNNRNILKISLDPKARTAVLRDIHAGENISDDTAQIIAMLQPVLEGLANQVALNLELENNQMMQRRAFCLLQKQLRGNLDV